MSANPTLFDRDVIRPTEWDHATARSAERDVTRRFHRGDHQSALAHQSIEPKKTAMQKQIHAFITECGPKGATCAEVEKALGLKHQTASARCTELRKDGQIFCNGLKRAAVGGQPGRVYVTSKGQLLLGIYIHDSR